MRKTFTIENPTNANPPESKVWFHLDFEDGKLVGFEEHDGYSGGAAPQSKNMEAAFVARVAVRGGDVAEAMAFLETAGRLTIDDIQVGVWYGGIGMPRVKAFTWEDGPNGVNYEIEGLCTIDALMTSKEGFVRLANGEPEAVSDFQTISAEYGAPAGTVINAEARTPEQNAFFAALDKM